MTDINKHPLIKQAYELVGEIEDLGASPGLTNCSILASNLMERINRFISDKEAPGFETCRGEVLNFLDVSLINAKPYRKGNEKFDDGWYNALKAAHSIVRFMRDPNHVIADATNIFSHVIDVLTQKPITTATTAAYSAIPQTGTAPGPNSRGNAP